MGFRSICCVIAILIILQDAECALYGKTAQNLESQTNIIDYKTFYFEQPVDHFGFENADTYKMRYLVADQYWDNNGGPIFFYCGNEGDITWFCNNTGIMWEWATEFKAMLVFAEHRYYGVSLPYGNDSFKDIHHVGYLTSEQALADFASLLLNIKATTPSAQKSPIIAFGGSYGGMLATWFRMKYPNVVQGSLAASAPIWMFGDMTPCDTFFKIVTKDFENAGPNCASNIRKSWSVINDLGKTDTGRQQLTAAFKLCKPLTSPADVQALKDWLNNMYGNLAMVDYPYPANFLEPLPAWPIKAVCNHLSGDSLNSGQLIQALGTAASVYYNYTGGATCLNISQQATQDLGDMGWGFQACSEMVMPMCSTGVDDMFEPSPWNLTLFTESCNHTWGVTPRPEWAITLYGGKNIRDVSNIIFSNGDLDPWSGGGVLQDLSDTLISIIIPEGAHHLDLRASNKDDPPSVIKAREQEKAIIQKWIKEYSTETYMEYIMESMSVMGHGAHIFNGGALWVRNTAICISGLVIMLSILSILTLLKSRQVIYHGKCSQKVYLGKEASPAQKNVVDHVQADGDHYNNEKHPLL